MENKRTCVIVQDLLPSYVEKLTKPETTAFVDAHLTICEGCRRVCRNMSGTLPAEAVQAEHVVYQLKKERNRRRLIGWGGVAAVILIAAVCLLPFPRQMNITQEGVLWQGGASRAAQTTQVTIQGTYYDYLLRADDFKGRIQVEALPETLGNMSITRLERNQYGIWLETKDALLKSFGGMFLRRDGSIFISIHDDGHWGADSGRMLTAPASTREEAVALTNELAKELSPHWLGTWLFK